MKIAILAPPWIPVPPPGYGGIEQVVQLLSGKLVERGHEVTMYAAPGSRSAAEVESPLDEPHPDEIQQAIYESDHVACAFDSIDAAAEPFDVVHDHCGFTGLAFANRLETPLVHTLHGPFTAETLPFFERHAYKAPVIALSRYQASQAPAALEVAAVIGNPMVVDDFPFRADKEDFLLWIGRLNDDKGPQRAIAAARAAGRELLLAGPVQPGEREFFAREVEPHLDGDGVRYIGEVGEEKLDFYARAAAFLMPIRWPEPFGLVMTEAMACGTPVIAFPEGAASELVIDGETGFLVNDGREMADAVGRLHEIDPARCRQLTARRFDVAAVTEAHERVYAWLSRSRSAISSTESVL
jgi:glycosyltransferase involved in cell wall biosynthesis